MANKTVYEILQEELTPEEFTKVDKAMHMCHYGKILNNDTTWNDIKVILKARIIIKPFLGETYDKLSNLYALADIESREKITDELRELLHHIKLYTHGKGPLSKEADELTEMVDSLERMMDTLKGGE